MTELDDILFPDHCSSCHSEWDSGYGYGEEPCCSKAVSNIRDSVKKFMTVQLDRIIDVCNDKRIQQVDTIKAFVEAERGEIGKL